MSEEGVQEIEIRIQFERGFGDPSRVFRSMAGLIEATQLLDTHLALSIGADVRTSLVLQDVEAASLKAKLRSVIEAVPDEPLRSGDIKKLIGHFLIQAKHRVLDWCSDRSSINSRDEVKQLESEIRVLAEQSDVKLIPAYAQLETATLLSDIASIKNALNYLGSRDQATFQSNEGISSYNPELVVSDSIVREIVTRETLASAGERILKVKKPDYLGTSKWGFKYAGHMIDAKVSDEEWLKRFQSNQENVQPGDSLRVRLREEVAYGYDNEIVHTEYEVLEVLGVIRGLRSNQTSIL